MTTWRRRYIVSVFVRADTAAEATAIFGEIGRGLRDDVESGIYDATGAVGELAEDDGTSDVTGSEADPFPEEGDPY